MVLSIRFDDMAFLTPNYTRCRVSVFFLLLPFVLGLPWGWAQKTQMAPEEVNFKSVDGMKIFGNLYRPEGSGPFPALVRVHGGFHGQAQPRSQDFYVDNGFAVLDVDYRGSDGHGKDYRNKQEMGGKEVDDVIAAGKYLQKLPYIKKDKLAILGDSRGAYITYCAIARQNPFKAAIAINGFTDLTRQYEYEADFAPNFLIIQKIMRTSPYIHPDKFRDLSPLNFASKVNVPVLILHGYNDHVVLVDQAWKMSEALFQHQKENDIIVLYAPEEDTGHTLKGRALAEAQKYSLNWLRKYLFPDEKK